MLPQELSLDCEALDEFRAALDSTIRKTVESLIERDLIAGTVTAKIKITIEKEEGRNGEPIHMMKIEPETSAKIGATGKLKCGEQNGIFLKYTEDGKPIIGEKQLEIDEFIREQAEDQRWSA